jgi:NAD(P)H-flavin reductase
MVQRKKISKPDLGGWLDNMAERCELVGPAKDEEVHQFRPVSSSAELDLECADADIVTTLEMKTKCGIGKCGRCNMGDKYICRDGPVFTFERLREIPGALEA